MSVCWDAEVVGRAPCGALSSQDSQFLPIYRMITRVADGAASAGGLGLDRQLHMERVLQGDGSRADEAGVAVGGAEVRNVERPLRPPPAKRPRRDEPVGAEDLRPGAHAL